MMQIPRIGYCVILYCAGFSILAFCSSVVARVRAADAPDQAVHAVEWLAAKSENDWADALAAQAEAVKRPLPAEQQPPPLSRLAERALRDHRMRMDRLAAYLVNPLDRCASCNHPHHDV